MHYVGLWRLHIFLAMEGGQDAEEAAPETPVQTKADPTPEQTKADDGGEASLNVFQLGLQALKEDGMLLSPAASIDKGNRAIVVVDSDDEPTAEIAPLPPAEISLVPRTAKRRRAALEAREQGATPFMPATGKRRRVSKGPDKATPEKVSPAAEAKATPASAGTPTEPLEKAVLCGPTKGKAPRYELCAKGKTTGKRVFLCSLSVASNPTAGDAMKSLREHVNATHCNKIGALEFWKTLIS